MPIELKMRNGVYHVVGTITDKFGDRVRIRKSTGFKGHQKRLADDELQRILRLAIEGEYKKVAGKRDKTSTQHAVDAFLNRPQKPGATDVSNGNLLVRSLGHKRFDSLTLDEVMDWAQSGGIAANSVARRLQTFSAVQTHAKNHGIPHPNLEIVKPVYDDARVRWLTEEERDHLIEYMPDRIRDMVTVMFFTGVRIGELCRMKWGDVVDNTVHVTSYKGRKKRKLIRAIPLPPQAVAAMGKRKAGLIFPTYTGTQWNRNNFYDFFYQGCDEVGIEDFHPHDCRHTYASLLVQKGASLRAVADLLGHTTLSMVMRYSHLSPSHLKKTVDLLGSADTRLTHGISFASAKVLKPRVKSKVYGLDIA